MEFFKESWKKASKKKKEYIILYEQILYPKSLWSKLYKSLNDKDIAIEEFELMKENEKYRKVRIICPINMEKILKFAEKMKELNEDGKKKI